MEILIRINFHPSTVLTHTHTHTHKLHMSLPFDVGGLFYIFLVFKFFPPLFRGVPFSRGVATLPLQHPALIRILSPGGALHHSNPPVFGHRHRGLAHPPASDAGFIRSFRS